jgi:hypothetical protein
MTWVRGRTGSLTIFTAQRQSTAIDHNEPIFTVTR